MRYIKPIPAIAVSVMLNMDPFLETTKRTPAPLPEDPISTPRSSDKNVAIARYVNTLADEWERETGGLSFMADRVTHRAYKSLLAMKMHAVPHLLVRMRQRGGLWFWLLSNVTGVRLQPIGDGGNVAAMTRAWLKWGVERGLIREE